MKSPPNSTPNYTLNVVPLVGTWIEIMVVATGHGKEMVVPLVGTWIEMNLGRYDKMFCMVVPLVGTWIEI